MPEILKLCSHCKKTYDRQAFWCPNCKSTTYWRVRVERDVLGIVKQARVLIEEGIHREHGIRLHQKVP